ncbi:ribosomal large subunit pseudouridine synthase B [Liquorilactobacillus sucicola DSM 21376 = JCM 15457]|uniref:Pseudouridine synthase n=1 Tax=Liquorilactobacillus sucicola DSM 21376 = JCM 15457 TaxID=1423806 RepID=A0A023CV84_9LACO|nr:pseudouridine synthase [Liquorilactobacillus sucicola]KRN05438.1 ribosomal large subunit pseudouridine synthase B [Liquorilactobacillus sucicola DSM 21376 = JCM 15457]GAJ25516.1 ribosomal large subunit pseudouridine synthase B [Liquorilactobacillus sucicola DSM 21376 = JCM 15457]
METERLQKVMANAGVASRRASERLITEGKVQVNGKTVKELGTKVEHQDIITVSGRVVEREKKVYYLFYKPRGVISAVSDDKGRKVVTDYFTSISERLYPVGRLDYDTSGLLIMTNDGELANKLMHPRYKIDKTYLAKVSGIPGNEALKKLRLGVRIDKYKTAPAKSKIISTDQKKKKALVSLTIHEGHNHQVKKMLAAVGYPVEKLRRDSYGFLTLQGLTSGDYRPLTRDEIEQLKK